MTAASLSAFKTKTCSKCGVTRPLDEFQPNPAGRLGRKSTCRVCNRKAVKAWAGANPERALEKKRRSWDRHKDRLNEARRESRGDHERELAREWRKRNPEKARNGNHQRRAATRNAPPAVLERIAYLLTQPCAYCGADQDIEIDHIIPLSRGGRHEADNLAAACPRCNRSKGNRLLDEWQGVA